MESPPAINPCQWVTYLAFGGAYATDEPELELTNGLVRGNSGVFWANDDVPGRLLLQGDFTGVEKLPCFNATQPG